MTLLMTPEYLISVLDSGSTVALTAPFVIKERVLIGFAPSSEESHCVNLALNEFITLCPSLYLQVNPNSKRIFHGLKRIWEFLDERGLRTDEHIHKYLDIHNIIDTKLMAYLLDPDSAREIDFGDDRIQEGLTLAYLAQRYLGCSYPYKMTDIYGNASLELASEILAYDACLIRRLADELPSLMSPDLMKLYRHVELPLMHVLDDMRRVRIGFDGIKCAEMARETAHAMAVLAAEITGGRSVDLKSHEEVHQFLIAQGVPLQVAPVYVRRRGLKKPLEQIAHAYPLVRKILAWWDMGRDLGFLRKWEGHTRIRAVWGQTRSATSRIYASNPAVQNISRELRKLFVPAPGHVLVKADYSQAQLRILAHLSGDPELVRVFDDPNGDVHRETSEWLGLNDRGIAKEINFAICFGMGKESLCAKINASKEKQGSPETIDSVIAQCYIDGFYGRFPKVREFFDREWEKLKKLPSQERVVRSLSGRERRFQRRPSLEMERQFRVTGPQQIEADLIKTAMLRLDRILRRRNMKARIVMVIHDALWVEAPHEEAEQVRHLLRKMMTTTGKLRVPLEVELG
jgi:DNA polymerase I